ncbi:MAG TPA: hypothetical protein VKN63_00085 [Afifellaceae bacterium]|nr:hypothetical protein [Afifellaceae bacterium]
MTGRVVLLVAAVTKKVQERAFTPEKQPLAAIFNSGSATGIPRTLERRPQGHLKQCVILEFISYSQCWKVWKNTKSALQDPNPEWRE